jgi:myo-inositol 2-dehydrogenase/D-chiro-inositol 1-dehydrogenase
MVYGIVGCGRIGSAHAAAVMKDERLHGLKLYDEIPEAAASLRERGGEVVSDIDEMLWSVDAVSITTPPGEHYCLTKRFLEKGVPVFCEKPLAMEEEQAAELVELSRRTGVPLMVGFKMRFEPVFVKAKELVPKLGNLLSVSTVKAQPITKNPVKRRWVSRVGAMYELSVHEMDLVTFITGRSPVRVRGSDLSFRFGWEREDGFSLFCEYAGGLNVSLSCYYAEDIAFEYRDLCMTFIGENGYIRVERPDTVVVHTHEHTTVRTPPPGDGFRDELASFLDAVEKKTGGPLDPHGSEGYYATALVEAAFRSGKERREETIIPLAGITGGEK